LPPPLSLRFRRVFFFSFLICSFSLSICSKGLSVHPFPPCRGEISFPDRKNYRFFPPPVRQFFLWCRGRRLPDGSACFPPPVDMSPPFSFFFRGRNIFRPMAILPFFPQVGPSLFFYSEKPFRCQRPFLFRKIRFIPFFPSISGYLFIVPRVPGIASTSRGPPPPRKMFFLYFCSRPSFFFFERSLSWLKHLLTFSCETGVPPD